MGFELLLTRLIKNIIFLNCPSDHEIYLSMMQFWHLAAMERIMKLSMES
jgi:hypothetical protein